MKPPIAIVLLAAAACATAPRAPCHLSEFVCWDALSDAANSAAANCAGQIELIEGADGLSAEDYRCVPAPPEPQPQANPLTPRR